MRLIGKACLTCLCLLNLVQIPLVQAGTDIGATMPRVFAPSYDSSGRNIYSAVDYCTEKSATVAVGYSNDPILVQKSMGNIP